MNADQARKIARLHLDVALALYRARERAEFSVESVAEQTGLNPERIVMIEEGDTTSLTEVAQLCDAIGITIANLLAEATDQPRPAAREGPVKPRILRAG